VSTDSVSSIPSPSPPRDVKTWSPRRVSDALTAAFRPLSNSRTGEQAEQHEVLQGRAPSLSPVQEVGCHRRIAWSPAGAKLPSL